MKNRLPRRRQTPPPSKQSVLIGALTSLVPAAKSSPGGKVGGKRKSAGGLALLAGLGAAAAKARSKGKGRSGATTPSS